MLEQTTALNGSHAYGTDHADVVHAIVEHAAEPMMLLDLAGEECLYVSPAIRSLLGIGPEDITGRGILDHVHPDDAAEVLARSKRRCQGAGIRVTFTRMAHANGRWIWIKAIASPVFPYRGRPAAVFTLSHAGHPAVPHIASAPRAFGRLLKRFWADELQTRDGTHDMTVEALAAALELRDDETGGHARRVTEFALALASEIAPNIVSDPELRYGFLLHDIGKIGIPDRILLKSEPLTPEEIRILQMHPVLGEHLLSSIPFLGSTARDVVAYHHEHWDGTGYPWSISGEQIPLAARIFAAADAFDAMTSDRPYRAALTFAEAVRRIDQASGTQFDPAVVDVFHEVVDRRRDVV